MSLERKKKELALKKIETAIMELEVKIEERACDIVRMQEHIKLQEEQKQRILKEIKSGRL